MAGLELRNIAKSYGSVPVIRNIDLSVKDGEFVVLVGPSGCGKSTILRMVAGLEDITSGEISIGDRVVNEMTPRERNIAMVFQSYALYPHMTVFQNMAFNLELSGKSKTEINQQVHQAARMLQLEPYLDRKPSQLSGGQRQRVAMGRAAVRNPAVFLFDEPLSNLDAKLRVQMRGEIKTLHSEVGVASIYVTHDQVEAMTLADRVVVLDHGVIQQEGSPLQLYRQPANRFVAGFIGSPAMNFLDAVIENGSARTAGGAVFPFAAETTFSPGHKVTVGIRPEHFQVTEDGQPGTVTFVEPTGSQTFVTLKLDGGEQTMVLVSGEDDVRNGDLMRVSAPVERTYVFDAETGARISTN